MIKINTATGQNLSIQDNSKGRTSGVSEDKPGATGTEVVSISEEGKKKHIMGQVMANLSGDEAARGRFRR
ncbi:MAG: hypothetical protein Q8P48_10295 [Deltaproteobacteria bacterium]|nr:hypothetical protein [Deltaproteobacteria bacterium]